MTISNGNRTEWSPTRSVIIRVIHKIGRPRSGSPICLISSMITDWIGRLLAWNGTISTKVTAIERSRYVIHVAMVAKFLDLLIENVTFIMTFLCMITLRVKLVDHTFRLSFDNANGRLCPKRPFKWKDVATMVTWRDTPPFFPLNA